MTKTRTWYNMETTMVSSTIVWQRSTLGNLCFGWRGRRNNYFDRLVVVVPADRYAVVVAVRQDPHDILGTFAEGSASIRSYALPVGVGSVTSEGRRYVLLVPTIAPSRHNSTLHCRSKMSCRLTSIDCFAKAHQAENLAILHL